MKTKHLYPNFFTTHRAVNIKQTILLLFLLTTTTMLFATSSTWSTTTSSTSWTTSANWSNGVPSSTKDAIINTSTTYPIINSVSDACDNITFNGSGSLSFAANPSYTLNVYGNFY